ncbi:hypothetical protein MRB53_019407 [Persea americana]|uniref:Uncharacterized protein n=1 Tax=Persea americana TaxID=3435 RepID=A0ACC2KY61_PERAE|nr:hypothetical protein MRB53_019407 [Persea americana]
MASSNRHWPSMFKSKPCNTHHQWQHDINSSLTSNSYQRTPYASGCEERSPEPKPRWNPKPEQIRILEAIFNSGMVNPPRDEIRKIRAQLQEYGQVGDANVFYWFQNRKSRSKHKQRHLQTAKSQPHPVSSFSSSSEKSSPAAAEKALALGSGRNVIEVASNSPTGSVTETYFQTNGDFSQEPFYFQVQAGGGGTLSSQGYCFAELSNMVQLPEPGIGPCPLLLGDVVSQEASKKEVGEKMKMQKQELHYFAATSASSAASRTAATTSSLSEMQVSGAGKTCGDGSTGPPRSTVFINDTAFEVAEGPISVREAFGEEAVLLHSSGQPVLTNEWGVTMHPLQHGAFYYLVNLNV